MEPKRKRGARLCIAVRTDGVTVYGNQTAFKSLAEWLGWIAKSSPKDHCECHLVWHFESHAGKRHPKNVRVLFDRRMAALVSHSRNRPDFDVTFMAVEAADLKALIERQKNGVLDAETASIETYSRVASEKPQSEKRRS